MNQTKKIKAIYETFCHAEGNQHIAGEYAILKLAEIIKAFKVKNVLEVGLGIGSIAGSILKATKADEINRYEGIENNAFCLTSLPANLEAEYKRLSIYPDLNSVPDKYLYDLIIIDGTDTNLVKIRSLISKHGVIAIEGDRSIQQKLLQDLFPGHLTVHTISKEKNKSYSPFPVQHWQSGLKIIFIEPTVHQYLWCYKEKISTKVKNLYRLSKY
ncbi:hypothetical protein VS868_12685 [Salinimicrobium sp. 3283s]|uniref:hypothetical protein n=1 Tax=Salinimicrobium sp. 3283s TaxID=3114359 RepID=UPI0031EEFDD1